MPFSFANFSQMSRARDASKRNSSTRAPVNFNFFSFRSIPDHVAHHSRPSRNQLRELSSTSVGELTIARDIELHQVLKVLDVGWKFVDFIVAQAELSESMQAKKVLKRDK